MLDFLGDLGGLYDALRIICRFLLAPFSAVALQVSLATEIFRASEHTDDAADSKHGQIQQGVRVSKDIPIESKGCLRLYVFECLFQRSKNKRYKRLVAKAERKIKKELDLETFMRR